MIKISVRDAVNAARKASQNLSGRQIATATSRSINETMLLSRTQARDSVKAIYNIPQRELKGINIRRASARILNGQLYASAKPIPMDAFSPKFQTSTASITITKKGEQKSREFKRKRKSAIGVTIEVIRGQKENVPYAFMLRGSKPRVFARGEYRSGSGSYGFVRRNKRVNKEGSDTPIKPLLSVTVHAAVLNQKSMDNIEKTITNNFPRVFNRNLTHVMSRIQATTSS